MYNEYTNWLIVTILMSYATILMSIAHQILMSYAHQKNTPFMDAHKKGKKVRLEWTNENWGNWLYL